jgi:hypothetical protein
MKKYLRFVALAFLMALVSCSKDNDENNNNGGNGGEFGGLEAGTFSFAISGDTNFTVSGSAILSATLADTGAVVTFSDPTANLFLGTATILTPDWAMAQTLAHADTSQSAIPSGTFFCSFFIRQTQFLGLSGELRIDGSSTNSQINGQISDMRSSNFF